jgi:uncharacterized protein
MYNKIAASPTLMRILPFAVFAALTLLQGRFGEASQYWIYAAKAALGAGILWHFRLNLEEMRWKLSWEAVAAGILVFVAWVGLDGCYPVLAARGATFAPAHTYGSGSMGAVFFTAVRVVGASLVVPPIEEVFYRSFLYRYLIKQDFLTIPIGHINWPAFLISGVVFGVAHNEWLSGILCAFAYQAVVFRKKRLGDAITAHAVTNLLLAAWVVFKQAYHFW